MHLVRRAPRAYSTVDPFAGFDSLFDSLLRPARRAGSEDEWQLPATDILETKDAFEVVVDLPGMKKDDIKVSLHEGVLTITAQRSGEAAANRESSVIRRERREGRFQRRFAIGPDVQDDKVDATFEAGVLTLAIPKLQPVVNQPRNIDIH